MFLFPYLSCIENHAYDHRRLTLVRYESLPLTKPEHKLTMMTSLDAMGSNRISKTEVDEYIVTSQVSFLCIRLSMSLREYNFFSFAPNSDI